MFVGRQGVLVGEEGAEVGRGGGSRGRCEVVGVGDLAVYFELLEQVVQECVVEV